MISMRLVIGVDVLCLLLGTTVPTFAQSSTVAVPADLSAARPVTVVLPFFNISGQQADAWIGEGIAATVLGDFQRSGLVSVVGPGPLLAEASKQGTPLSEGDDRIAIEIGRRLGVAWLVRGGYQRVNDQVRITARIVDVQTGAVVRTAKVDGAVARIFELEDLIVKELGAEGRAAQPPAPVRAGTGPAASAPRADGSAPLPANAPVSAPGSSAAASGARSPANAPAAPAGGAGGSTARTPVVFDSPPAPVAPATMSERDAKGRLTVRAVRLTAPLNFDGKLDDEVYSTVPPISGFIQQEPNEGQPATEPTNMWIFFDDNNVYISARMFSSQPTRIRANEMRRDSNNLLKNDFFYVTMDTLFDHRSGIFLLTNALGGQRDALLSDEQRGANFDFNPIWDVKTSRDDKGWTTEFVVPFKSLRYLQRRDQVWAVMVGRADWWKNELTYLTPVPRSSGMGGGFRVSLGATIVGIEAPPPALNLDIKPYVTGFSNTLPSASGANTSYDKGYGVDVKYGLTKTLAADFTYKTDFAQAEVDDQQINLTRFNLFYPEKREFFLEGQGLFAFGGATTTGPGPTPILFFSRQIGLNNGQAVPIEAGGRLMGKAGKFNLGVLSIRTDEVPASGSAALVPATQFSVMRVKRDILRRSNFGIIATERTPSVSTNAENLVFGADLNLNLFTNIEAVTYYARSRTAGRKGDDESYRGRFFYNGDKYGGEIDHLKIGDAFNPEMGFVSRSNLRRTYGVIRYSPRPKIRGVRKLTWDARFDNIEGATLGNLQTRVGTGTFKIDFQNGDVFTAEFDRTQDRPDRAFALPGGVVVQPGVYDYQQTLLTYALGSQRGVTGSLTANTGTYYGGRQDAVGYNGRVEVTKQLGVEPRITVTWLNLGGRRVRTELFSARTTFSMTPRMFVTAFLQYNSAANVVGLNTRFKWEWRPGSDFFFVYSEGRDTAVTGFPGLSNRQLVAKFTRLFRF